MGSSESVYCGVPMVLTPMYGDQYLNSAASKARGIGFIVPYEDITEETIKNAINEALKPSARQTAKQVSYSYTHRPKTAAELAVWWTEYVAETKGAPLLQSHSKNLSIIEYYSLDIYATFALAFLIVVFSWIYIINKCVKRISTKKTKYD